MTNIKAKTQQPVATDESSVITYLRNNPQVLMAYPEIFRSLEIPHQTDGAISLVGRQLKMLRDENQLLKSKLDDLVSIARENEELNQRFHRFSLELMSTDQLHDVLATVQDQVQTYFYTDFVCFRFLPGITDKRNFLNTQYLDAESGIVKTIQPWLDQRKPVCGEFDESIHQQLFGDNVKVKSCALIPLYHTQNLGLLCLGSVSKKRFNESIGTIFLQQLGELVSNRLQGLLVSHS